MSNWLELSVTLFGSLCQFFESPILTNCTLLFVAYQATLSTMSHNKQAPAMSRNIAMEGGSLFKKSSERKLSGHAQQMDEVLTLLRKMESDISTIKLQLASSGQGKNVKPSAPPAYTSRLYPGLTETPYH